MANPTNPSNRPQAQGIIILAALFLIGYLITQSSMLYSSFLWFSSLNFESVFIKILSAKVVLFFIGFLSSAIFLGLNLYVASSGKDSLGRQKYLIVLAIAFLIGLALTGFWDTGLKFLHKTDFGITDPIFEMDLGFYIFSLPVYKAIQGYILILSLMALIGSILLYVQNKEIKILEKIQEQEVYTEEDFSVDEEIMGLGGGSFGRELNFMNPEISKKATIHLYLLGALALFALAVRHHLDAYSVLYSAQGVIYGAGYSDIHALLPALNVMVFLAAGAGALCLAAAVFSYLQKPSLRSFVTGILLLYVLVGFLGTGVFPTAIQQLEVQPNELSLEEQYIEHNIEYTRKAYGIDKIKEESILPKENDTLNLSNNREIIRNIRLWDWRPTKQTYEQMQEIRSYYEFNDIDVDRYRFEEGDTQVMLSAREMNTQKLGKEAESWVNTHLIYTHGYGLVMSPVNRVSEEGLPHYFIKDIPPKSSKKALNITNPAIYYGEKTNNYVIVDTNAREFDYPKGDDNKFTNYQGEGGVLLKSVLEEAIMGLRFGEINFLLSQYIEPGSKILMNRNIDKRVRQVAPFLKYDADPYPVTVDGKIYWIQDAYTATDKYPYSRPYRGINYVRNSVKIVVDAYSGKMNFYVVNENDPLIQTYQSMFPKLFKPYEEMPDKLKQHVRYPEDLFNLQTQVYGTYHMQNPNVFYNNEDQWEFAKEVYGQDRSQGDISPYYVITRLPGKEKAEFIIMVPLTPKGKDNMIAWMTARSDEPNYGERIIYKFPKDKLVYGPMQIEARINQDDEISQQLTLWSQRGSNVIRGNLLVIPTEEDLLYVEPLYIRSEEASMPELKRVILSYKKQVVMEDNLQEALEALFIGKAPEQEKPDEDKEQPENLEELIKQATEQYNKAQKHREEGNWSGFGTELENLEKTLSQLESLSKNRTG